MINVQWCWLLHSLSCQITRKGTSLPNDIQICVSWKQHGTDSELIGETLRGTEAPNHVTAINPSIKIQSSTSNVVSYLIQENERKFLDDCQGSLLQLPQLSLLSVSGLRDPLWHRQRSVSFDSLELCLYLHLCLYLYLLLSVNSDIPSEHTVLQHLDSHNYNIYSLSVWVFQ